MTDAESSIQAPKSIPHAIAVWTPLEGVPVGDNTGGTSTPVVIDFELQPYHEGLLIVEAKTTNGQGDTPTSPGSSKTIAISVAFSNDFIAPSDVTALLSTATITSLTATLPNSNSAGTSGRRYFQSDPFIHRGRYAYVWYTWDALAVNASVALTVKLVRL